MEGKQTRKSQKLLGEPVDLSIIIPCYNEVENIPKLQQELVPVVTNLLRQYPALEIVFVDDGSGDKTLQTLQQVFEVNKAQTKFSFEIQFARHEKNCGLGAALRTGFSKARGEILVTTDSDGTYRFSTINNLLSYLQPNIDLVTASPYHPLGGVAGVPAYRLVLSRGSSLIYRILLRRSIHTYTSLFRAYRRKLIERVPFTSDGFLAGTEILVNSLLMGYQVAEFPTVLYARVAGLSKAKLMRTILAHLRFQWRLFLHQVHLVSMLAPEVHS